MSKLKKFDYEELKLLIIRKYGSIRNFCYSTKAINETHLSRILNNFVSFSQNNISIIVNALGIASSDIGLYFFTEKV